MASVVGRDAERARYWEAARARLDGLPGGRGLNIAHEAVDRHATGATADRVALRWIARDGSTTTATYAELAARTNRFANVLDDLGVGEGDNVFTLLGRVPELHVAVLGTLKHRSAACPLFSSLGPDPVRHRLDRGDGRVLVTTPTLYRRKVAGIRAALPGLEHVLLVGGGAGDTDVAGAVDLRAALRAASDAYEIPPTDPEDVALLHFTSGTTGMPKAVVHVHDAVVVHHATAGTALDLRADDVFWCTADPGWVTGTSYGVVAPLTRGVTSIVDEADFDADRWYRIVQDRRVTVWYTAPTALRMLVKAGADLARRYDLASLRVVASVGEALDPEIVAWAREALGRPVHDGWWQTETGGIMIANLPGDEIRPGSMGQPLPGVDATVLRLGPDGRAAVRDGAVEEVDEPGAVGELALRRGWPSMFRGYLHEDERYARRFAGDWYLTGDLVRRDGEGWVWFVGRADDMINTAGHLVGPFEVERVLMQHPAVLAAAVVGVPEPVAGEIVKAFVTLRPGHAPTEELRLDLLGFARRRLGPGVAPREIAFDDHLPMTDSGKITRRRLREGS